MEKTHLTRKELYDLVWNEPLTSIAKRYKISDTGLHKICKRMEIPLPIAGYWMKKKFGKKVHIEPFKMKFDGVDSINLIKLTGEKQLRIQEESPLKIRQKEIEADGNINLKIPIKLNNPDPLIFKYKQHLQLRPHWKDYNRVYEFQLHINVTEPNQTRAILIMDTLIKAIKQRGHDIKVDGLGTFMIINGEELKVNFREKNKRIENPNSNDHWDRYKFISSGILQFAIEGYRGKYWFDGKVPLEGQLSNIIAKMEIESETMKIDREKMRIWHLELEKQRKIEEELKNRKQKELKDFIRLVNDANRWKNLTFIRQYIEQIEGAIQNGTSSNHFDLKWLNWAKAKADWYDPSINLYDELMADVDRNNLEVKEKKYSF